MHRINALLALLPTSGTLLSRNANLAVLILTMTPQQENASAAHLDSPSIPTTPNANALLLLPSTTPTLSNVLPAQLLESGTTRPTPATAQPPYPTETPPLELVGPAQLPTLSGTENLAFLVQLELTTTQGADAAAVAPLDCPTTLPSTPAPLRLDQSIGIISLLLSNLSLILITPSIEVHLCKVPERG